MKYTILFLLLPILTYGQKVKETTNKVNSIKFLTFNLHPKNRPVRFDTVRTNFELKHKIRETKAWMGGFTIYKGTKKEYRDCEYRKIPSYYAIIKAEEQEE